MQVICRNFDENLNRNIMETMKSEIIWTAGIGEEDLCRGPGTRYLFSGKKFSNYDEIIIVASLHDFEDKIIRTHDVETWRELSQQRDYIDLWPAVYLSDIAWNQNYGVMQWAGAGIHRIIGVNHE